MVIGSQDSKKEVAMPLLKIIPR